MSHYLIEQIAALPNIEVRTAQRGGRGATASDGRLRAPPDPRRPDGDEHDRGRRRLLRLHRRRCRAPTGWTACVARDERGFILAGPDVREARLAARARPLPARDQRARRVRRRRRARALDQARGERGRRGLDGGLADPRVPGEHMTPSDRRGAAADRPVRRRRRRAARRVRGAAPSCATAAPGELIAEAGREPAPACISSWREPSETFREINGGRESSGEHVAPTYLGAIAALTGSARSACGCRPKTDVRLAYIDSEEFRRAGRHEPLGPAAVLEQVRPVVGRITAIEQNRERLASLGTMAAGLAHELNNPAVGRQARRRGSGGGARGARLDDRRVRRIGRRARAGRAARPHPARGRSRPAGAGGDLDAARAGRRRRRADSSALEDARVADA